MAETQAAPAASASSSPVDAATANAAAEVDALLFKRDVGSNKRSIPEAIFIENVEAICAEREQNFVLTRLQELYSKYQYMQSSLTAQRSSLKTKLPDISSALETVQHLIAKRDGGQDGETSEYTYQLSENIFARAAVPPTNVVCLWLGANCMLEYTLEEAIDLLKTNEGNAKETLKTIEEDMAFLRDQITTTEVNIARTHNYGVKLRQKTKDQDAAASAEKSVAASSSSAAPASSFSPAPRNGGPAGGEGLGYTWKQEAEEVEVYAPVPSGAQKSDIKVTIHADSLKIEHAGKVLLQGELAGKCRPDGSTWTLSSSGRVEVTLEKAEAAPWSALFETG